MLFFAFFANYLGHFSVFVLFLGKSKINLFNMYFTSTSLISFATTILIAFVSNNLTAQNVGINSTGATPDASAMLDVVNTSKGMLIPRVALTATNAAGPITTPATSLLVYNTATAGASPNNVVPGFYYWDGSAWIAFMGDGGRDWALTGNAGTTAGTNFLGTTDSEDIVIKTDGTEYIRINGEADAFAGFVGIGNTSPQQPLHVTGDVMIGAKTDNSGYDANSEFLKITSQSDIWTLGVQNEATVGASDFFIGLNDDTEDGIFHIENGGNIGVGTIAPAEKLHVTDATDTDKRTIYGYADQASTAVDYDNIGVFGFATGGSSAWGNAAGVVGVGDQAGSWKSIGVLGYLGATTPDLSANYDDDVAIYGDGNALGYSGIFMGGNVGIATTTPDDQLDVVGNAQVSGYLKVGSPAAPTSMASTEVEIYKWGGVSTMAAWTFSEVCDASAAASWGAIVDDLDADHDDITYMQYGYGDGYSKGYAYSPWMWIPTDATNIEIRTYFYCNSEDDYDGMYAEYSTGGAYSKIASWPDGGDDYPDAADGSNGTCTGIASTNCWNGNLGDTYARKDYASISGTWFRVRFVGVEDAGTVGDDFIIKGFSVTATVSAFGGAFASGNIYAEQNVYAGSNVLLGDVAEYFEVKDDVKPGDLISIDPLNRDSYHVTSDANDPNLIGVYSTNPTLTLNDPTSGIPVGLQGRVPININTTNGKIKIGDYLTSSSISGVAMKATKNTYVIGRALENYSAVEDGQILCMLSPGWYSPGTSSNSNGGTFFISKGADKIVVNDNSIQKDSRIFVSMLGNTGTNHWISQKEDGKFELSLGASSIATTHFDYFVDNANSNTTNKEVVEEIDQPLMAKKGKKTSFSTREKIRSTQLHTESGSTPPSDLPDQKGGYIWTTDLGLINTYTPPKQEEEKIEMTEEERNKMEESK